MNLLKKLFTPAAGKIEVVFSRNCFVAGEQYLEGERATFDARTAAELVGNGAAFDPLAVKAHTEKRESLASLLPAPIQPEPVPESWKPLPDCFARWHTLHEARAALVARMEAIEAKLMDIYKNNAPPNFHGAQSLPPDHRRKLFAVHVGHESNIDNEAANYLKDALQRAKESVAEWQAANQDGYVRAQLECSTHTQLVHGELCRNIRELHSKAFDLFALRISALGLNGHKVAELFQGSADCERFASIEAPSLLDRKLAWADPGQDPVHYIAQPPTVLDEMLAGYAATAAKVEALAKLADKELNAAKRVTAAA